ncbi:MAG: small subunit ribosomal protein S3Ae [Candidatus Woesearchaeota archaeon]|nr:small subunit ribosomal protein S3Ae [Candidatus Woesearchaeota archaeon]MDN5327740.1 small subunit ribosomal protein S3Ae [Candidatus Woesearchaeota archaeon]
MAKEKKKKWLKVYAPKVLNEVELPSILASEAKETIGRTISLNLMFVTNSVRDRDYNVKLEIVDASDEKCKTEVIRLNILPSSIKKKVRKRKDRIDDSFVVATKDNKLVRVKPLILTANNSSKARQTFLRKAAKYLLFNEISSKTYEEVLKELFSKNLSKKIYETLNSLHPISYFDIRVFELVKKTRVKVVSKEELAGFELKAPKEEKVKEKA